MKDSEKVDFFFIGLSFGKNFFFWKIEKVGKN